MHPIRNQYRTNFTTIMNRKDQYIAAKSKFSCNKKQMYNIRAMHTEKSGKGFSSEDVSKIGKYVGLGVIILMGAESVKYARDHERNLPKRKIDKNTKS
jgi:hypothetical protein